MKRLSEGKARLRTSPVLLLHSPRIVNEENEDLPFLLEGFGTAEPRSYSVADSQGSRRPARGPGAGGWRHRDPQAAQSHLASHGRRTTAAWQVATQPKVTSGRYRTRTCDIRLVRALERCRVTGNHSTRWRPKPKSERNLRSQPRVSQFLQ